MSLFVLWIKSKRSVFSLILQAERVGAMPSKSRLFLAFQIFQEANKKISMKRGLFHLAFPLSII
jgi:hypothetical protein